MSCHNRKVVAGITFSYHKQPVFHVSTMQDGCKYKANMFTCCIQRAMLYYAFVLACLLAICLICESYEPCLWVGYDETWYWQMYRCRSIHLLPLWYTRECYHHTWQGSKCDDITAVDSIPSQSAPERFQTLINSCQYFLYLLLYSLLNTGRTLLSDKCVEVYSDTGTLQV